MSELLEHLTELHKRALDRYLALQAEAEQASDRGGRGPTPADLAEARSTLARHEQQLQLAVAKAAPSIPLRRIR